MSVCLMVAMTFQLFRQTADDTRHLSAARCCVYREAREVVLTRI